MADPLGWNVTDRIAIGCTSIAVGVAAALSGWPAGFAGALIGAGIGTLAVAVVHALGSDR